MNTNLFFLQMSGVPGSGKTTVAQAIAAATNGVVIDHDVTKSALLDAEIAVDQAGKASYFVLFALAEHLLKQGKSVIFDSPCFYDNILHKGQQFAARYNAKYLYIECSLWDIDELDKRLQLRERHRSQLAGVYAPPTAGSGKSVMNDKIFLGWMTKIKRPKQDYLQLDSSVSAEIYTQLAVDYVLAKV